MPSICVHVLVHSHLSGIHWSQADLQGLLLDKGGFLGIDFLRSQMLSVSRIGEGPENFFASQMRLEAAGTADAGLR